MFVSYKKNSPWLYIPIETKTRELHAKVLLACFAAKTGMNVVFGQKNLLRAQVSLLPRGTYFYYGLAENFAKDIRSLNNEKFNIAALDEEGLVFYNCDFYQRFRVSENTLQGVKFFFAWGKNQVDCICSKIPNAKGKVIFAGNPRFDLLRPEFNKIFKKDTEKIRDKYKPNILINTNFFCNHFSGLEYYKNELKKRGWIVTPNDESYHNDLIQYNLRMFDYFIVMTKQISRAFPMHSIVVRPHPSESIETWKKVMADYPNVKIIHEGNVIPWILVSDVLIHNGCTTGIEAAILGKPAIAYNPEVSDRFDLYLPNALNCQVDSLEELISKLKTVMETGSDLILSHQQTMKEKILPNYIEGIYGQFASEKIANTLTAQTSPESKIKCGLRVSLFLIKTKMMITVKQIYRFLKNSKIKTSSDYLQHKFSGTNVAEISDIIQSFGNTEDFSNIIVSDFGEDLYLFTKKG